MFYAYKIFTYATEPISFKAIDASTVVAAISVSAVGIGITGMCP